MVVAPLARQRVRPYALAGVGLAHLRQRYRVGPSVDSVELTRSSRALALSVGGGLEVQISDRLAFGVDVRARHLFDEEAPLDRFIMPAGTLRTLRAGSHVSWRF
jgi:opacity protein-like surface antigen